MSLVENTERGLYCRAGDFYIDPWSPVDRAVITHSHSDHLRWGSKKYLTAAANVPVLT
ncbi:MAG: DNA ligase-associated DEXH box helicase, partial [Planctomycetales bacterium]|nr:DNA ligase-associated DEXH box helicase [Planctomycetales bacterium]